jgi:hypothetical protein
LPEQSATELLTAWRDAERALEAATNGARRAELQVLVESLRDQYQQVFGAVAIGRHDAGEAESKVGQP